MLSNGIRYIFSLIHTLTEKLPVNSPYNTLIGVFILTLIFSLSVIIIGFFIQKLKDFEFESLSKHINQKLASFIVFRLTFPGTIIHEFAHATFAFITGAKVNKIQCFSLKKDTFGYVEYTTRGSKVQQMMQHSITACAPVILGLILLPTFIGMVPLVTNTWLKVLFIYLSICMLNHMNMSSTDIKNYLRGLPVLFVVMYAINYIMFLAIK